MEELTREEELGLKLSLRDFLLRQMLSVRRGVDKLVATVEESKADPSPDSALIEPEKLQPLLYASERAWLLAQDLALRHTTPDSPGYPEALSAVQAATQEMNAHLQQFQTILDQGRDHV